MKHLHGRRTKTPAVTVLCFTYLLLGSYNMHSFDLVFLLKAVGLLQSAGNEQLRAGEGTLLRY